jgi:signal transduction histidine kinase
MADEAARRAEVLIVDDTTASLDLLGELLAGAGYAVRPAQDGRMALRSAKARPPDLILLDVRMPGIDGYEVCRQLKDDARTRDVPVIFLSALRDTGDKVRGFGLGAVDYIAKPFQPEEVLARVRTHVELRRLQTKLEERVAERTAQLQQSEAELRESQRRLQELTGFLQSVREEERTTIARELHDELGQTLTALRIDLGALRRDCPSAGAAAMARVGAAHGLVERIIDTLRRISEGLRPGVLDALGLAAAIEHLTNDFAERAGIACTLTMNREDFDLDDRLAIVVFRVVQESLTNVSRHAQAGSIDVDIREAGDRLRVEVRDDGVGIDPAGKRQGFGLLGMRERVAMLGGSLDIVGTPGAGTRIVAEFPIVRGERP